MDPCLHETLDSSNGFQLENQSMDEFSNWKLGTGPGLEISYPDQKLVNGHSFQEQSIGTVSTSFVGTEDDNQNDRDLSDGFLRCIDQILMEEDMEDNMHMLHESSDLQAKEKSLYELLGEKYPTSVHESALNNQFGQGPDNNYVYQNSTTSNSDGSGYPTVVVDRRLLNTFTDNDAYCTNHIVSNPSISSSSNLNNVMYQFSDSTMSPPQVGDMYSKSQVVWDFTKGVENAIKFAPIKSIRSGIKGSSVQNPKKGGNSVDNDEVKIKSSRKNSEARGQKNQHTEENDCEEERSKKLPAVDRESDVPIEEFDDVWIYTLNGREKFLASYMADLQIEGSKTVPQGWAKSRCGRCGKKQNKKKQMVDMTSLLIKCAQSVNVGDHLTANELLKQIRQHSSPFGDAHQRLAHYFADGLEARLSGTGSQIHKALVHERETVPDYLKAYCLSLASSSFRKISNFASNKMIMIKSEKATRIHIIDFGILYGFQWPIFIQRLAKREGGPPKLRITGIGFPQPGSQPAERIEETGRRLAHYAKIFNVPFAYNAIAQKWETIKLEDLEIEKDEFVAVTCSFGSKSLVEETVEAESSKTKVLDLIRNINPDIFIHGIINGSYGGPFFVDRFRKVLSHFSVLFDMLETIMPGNKPERLVIERDIYAKDALNVIACEGLERTERPETYKQWQVRHRKAGFVQVLFERKLMDIILYNVRNFYHRDYIVDEDNK